MRSRLAVVSAALSIVGLCAVSLFAQAPGLSEATFALPPGASYKTLVISKRTIVKSDLIVPPRVALRFEGGALEVAAGKTLTINGSLDAPMQKIFDGKGKVVFGPGRVKEVYPQWWGARGDGKADDTAAIQSAIDSLPRGGTLFFAPGTYANRGVTTRSNITFKGAGVGASTLFLTAKQGACITLPKECASFRLQDMSLRSTGPNEAYGIDGRNEYVRYFSMNNFHITGFKTGVYIAQGMHISLDYGYIGCYGQGAANGTVCLKLGDKPTNKGCTTATIKDLYLTNAETDFYNRAAPCLLIRPIFETCQIGLDNYTRAILVSPFMEAAKKADARMTDNGALFIGVSASQYKFLYAGEAEKRRTSLDSGHLRLSHETRPHAHGPQGRTVGRGQRQTEKTRRRQAMTQPVVPSRRPAVGLLRPVQASERVTGVPRKPAEVSQGVACPV